MPETTELQPTVPCSARLITNLPDLEDLAKRLLDSPLVSVDTESDSLYSYAEKICLVQFSIPDEDFIVDPLSTFSLEPLADVFASPTVEKVFHGADYDLVSLKRGYGFHFTNIFDTMLTARILGRKNTGLAALVAQHMGLRMDKSQQRSDWGKRPLSPEQLAYACHDTRYLIALRDLLLTELRQKGRETEAREVFANLAKLEPRPHTFDPDAFWNIKGIRDLDMAGRRIVCALHKWREEQARWEDRPAFKVINDHTFVEIAQQKPVSADALRRSHLLSPYQMTRYSHQVLDAINRAQRDSEPLLPPRPRNNGSRPDDLTLSIYERLRAWRKERAAERGVEPDVIGSNDLLMTVATRRPSTRADLDDIAGFGVWRRAEYGADMVALVESMVAATRKRK